MLSHKFLQVWGARGQLETHYDTFVHKLGPTELHWPKGLICSRHDPLFSKALCQRLLNTHSE